MNLLAQNKRGVDLVLAEKNKLGGFAYDKKRNQGKFIASTQPSCMIHYA